jgi:beta-galactosidase
MNMRRNGLKYWLLAQVVVCTTSTMLARTTLSLETGWKFCKGDPAGAMMPSFEDKDWETVQVPHDWAIYGPFDGSIDKQVVAIDQNNERMPTEKTGRTGGLPYIGTAWYRNKFNLSEFQAGKELRSFSREP